jgi:hypothetical protein
MAKNNPKKHFQLLSPENYIRQKARNLPIYQCRINNDWDEGKLANIIIARNHTNGNITFCLYLVDLGCLGVKDSMYYFNMPVDEYEDYLVQFEEKLPSKSISYELAHNIIYAAIEFAEEYGFKPCKEYVSTTKYMLEDDTDDIELIEIEVGDKYGDPLFVSNGYESPTRVNQILNQLDKTAGKDNYTYIDNVYDKGIEKLSKAETLMLVDLTDSIYNHLCTDVEINDYIESWQNEHDLDLNDTYNQELLGVKKDFVITDKLLKVIDETLIQIEKKPEKAGKEIDKLEKLIGRTHFIAFLKLEVLKVVSPSEVTPKLKEYINEYPDCSMLKLQVEIENSFSQNALFKTVPEVETIFEGRESITSFEMFRYWNDKLLMISNKGDLNMLEAFYLFIDELVINEDLKEMLESTTELIRIFTLNRYLQN